VGSAAAAGWIAHIVFWTLVIWGYLTEGLGTKAAIVFVVLWFVPSFLPPLAPFFTSYAAVLDIVLVFLLFGRDVRLT